MGKLANVAAIILALYLAVILGRNNERKSWCAKQETPKAFDECLNKGAPGVGDD